MILKFNEFINEGGPGSGPSSSDDKKDSGKKDPRKIDPEKIAKKVKHAEGMLKDMIEQKEKFDKQNMDKSSYIYKSTVKDIESIKKDIESIEKGIDPYYDRTHPKDEHGNDAFADLKDAEKEARKHNKDYDKR